MARKATATQKLGTYRAKRDFRLTPEPSGDGPARDGPPAPDGHRFVVQRHRARRLHYDVRLEIDGVLVSWAVPKGPTLDPAARRLAVHVEDHPLDYFDFEGVIPSGEYGGGDVIVWDWGTWAPGKDADPLLSIERGDLHVDLTGQKLAGRFVLVRTGKSEKEWMLLHKKDAFAVAGWDAEDHPRSVKTGRTNDEVAAEPAAVWHSDREGESEGDRDGAAPVRGREASRKLSAPTPQELGALDDLRRSGTWVVHGRAVELTGLDVPIGSAADGSSLTVRDLVRYHAAMAPLLLPYLAGRAVHLHRFRHGVEHAGSWTRRRPRDAPAWIPAGPIQLDTPAGLAWAAGLRAVEIQPELATLAEPQHPSWVVIGVRGRTDAGGDDVRLVAGLVRAALDHLGLQAAPVAGDGYDLWIPVAAEETAATRRTWGEGLVGAVSRTVPDLVSPDDARGGSDPSPVRLVVSVAGPQPAPFTVRAAPGLPVAVPLRWEEVDDPQLRPGTVTIDTVAARVRAAGDPLAPLIGRRQHLPPLDT